MLLHLPGSVRPHHISALTGLSRNQFVDLVARTWERSPDGGRGRPWALAFHTRVLITVVALRTNLTEGELAALFDVPKSQVHRVLADMTPKVAATFAPLRRDRRETRAVDGTLVPCRDYARAGKSKNYRWSTNHWVVVRCRDTAVVHVARALPGNRNDPVAYRGEQVDVVVASQHRVLSDSAYRACQGGVVPPSRGARIDRDDPRWVPHRRRRARVEHGFARLKDWWVLRDCRRRGNGVDEAFLAVAAMWNLPLGVQ